MPGESPALDSPPEGEGSFWNAHQPGVRFAQSEPGSEAFFAEVERDRYTLEPHIPAMAQFARWRGRDVLEAGCGIATDGIRFAREGARYTGLDASPAALELGRRRFELEGAEGTFVLGSITELPFPDESFDLVYSHGVIHHIADTEAAVSEFHRVLRPGGTALTMVYHRGSLNYRFTIMGLRRLSAALLLVPGGVRTVARVTGEDRHTLEEHRRLLRRHGLHYLSNRELFLANNTDGPGNLISKVYSRDQARCLFGAFAAVKVTVRHLNLRIYPGGGVFARTAVAKSLERRFGWHLYVDAQKAPTSGQRVGDRHALSEDDFVARGRGVEADEAASSVADSEK